MYIFLPLLAALLILLRITFLIKYRRLLELSNKMPRPSGELPLFGHCLLFRNGIDCLQNTLLFSREMKTDYVGWFGPQMLLILQEPRHLEFILRNTNILKKAWGYNYGTPWLGKGLVLNEGNLWKSRRKLITPAFHFKILEGFIDVFNSNVDVLIKKLKVHADGPEFNVFINMSLFALDTITESSLGGRIDAQNNGDSKYVQSVETIMRIIANRFFRPWYHFDFIFNMTPMARRQNEALSVLHSQSKKCIQQRQKDFKENPELLKSNNEADDTGERPTVPFLDTLIRASANGTVLTERDIREEVDTIMAAGHDTTGESLSLGCWALGNNPDIQERLYIEIKEWFGDSERPPTYSDLQEIKYLDMVVKEILRLYPTIPIFARETEEDIDIGDYVIPPGCNVIIIPFSLHRQPHLYPDPDKFDPERFLPENVLKRNPYVYLPFSAGVRSCIGNKYAALLMKAALIEIVRNFRIISDSREPTLEYRVSLYPSDGVFLRLESRHK